MTTPYSDKIKYYFYFCLQECFQMRLEFNKIDLKNEIVLPSG